MKRAEEPMVIGWREVVSLPAWGVTGVHAKADTGARSSAIDVLDITELPGEKVRFHVALSRRNRHKGFAVEVVTRITRRSRVRSAHGTTHDRLFVQTPIRIGRVTKLVELGLVCRKAMICRMLVGRSALASDFLVDSERTYVVTDKPAVMRRALKVKAADKAAGLKPRSLKAPEASESIHRTKPKSSRKTFASKKAG